MANVKYWDESVLNPYSPGGSRNCYVVTCFGDKGGRCMLQQKEGEEFTPVWESACEGCPNRPSDTTELGVSKERR